MPIKDKGIRGRSVDTGHLRDCSFSDFFTGGRHRHTKSINPEVTRLWNNFAYKSGNETDLTFRETVLKRIAQTMGPAQVLKLASGTATEAARICGAYIPHVTNCREFRARYIFNLF